MPRVRLYPSLPISPFWRQVIAATRALPDGELLAMVHAHLERTHPGDPLAVLAAWRLALPRGAPQASPAASPRPEPRPTPHRLFTAALGPSLPAPERPIEGATPVVERFAPARRLPPAPSQPWIRLPSTEPRPGEHPPAKAVHLVVLQVAQVRRSKDVFRCEVYEARIKAKTCISRQYTVAELDRIGRGAARQRLGARTQYVGCARCEVGQQIQRQVVARDKGEIRKRICRVRDGRLPPKYASGPIRE